MAPIAFQIHPIGVIHIKDKRPRIEIDSRYEPGLKGLAEFSHLHVFYWFDQNDTQEKRSVLQVHPMKNPAKPLTGVFATHSPMRPNLIAHTVCHCIEIKANIIYLDKIDALDGSPVIDIKGYLPESVDPGTLRVPAWVRNETDKDNAL